MPFKVQIGPPQISIHQGQTVLISDPDGQINWPSEKGSLLSRYARRQQLDRLRQWRALGVVERRSRHLLRGAYLPDQSGFRDGSGHHCAAHTWLHHKPVDSSRNARRSRHYEQQYEAGKISARDRHPLRFRRSLRGEIRQYCSTRTNHNRMGTGTPTALHDLSQQRL